MGHLARVLAFQYGLNVTCVEQDRVLLQQARCADCYNLIILLSTLIITLLQEMGSRIANLNKKAYTYIPSNVPSTIYS